LGLQNQPGPQADSELLITEAAAQAPAAAPASAERFTKVTNKLFHAINTMIRLPSRQP